MTRGFCRVLFTLACVLLCLLILFVTYEVIMRYIFNAPTKWSYEIDGYLYVAIVLLALGYAQSQDKHMKMDLVVSKLSGKRYKVMHILLALFGSAYAVLLLVFGWEYAYAAFIKGYKASSTFASPLWPSYMALPLGALGLALEYIVEIVEDIINFNKDGGSPAGDVPPASGRNGAD